MIPAPPHTPVCNHCSDTHLMPFGDPCRSVPCTRCPVPCQKCRAGGTGAFCEHTPCACECHGARETPQPITFRDDEGLRWTLFAQCWPPDNAGSAKTRDATPADLARSGYTPAEALGTAIVLRGALSVLRGKLTTLRRELRRMNAALQTKNTELALQKRITSEQYQLKLRSNDRAAAMVRELEALRDLDLHVRMTPKDPVSYEAWKSETRALLKAVDEAREK